MKKRQYSGNLESNIPSFLIHQRNTEGFQRKDEIPASHEN